MLEDLERAVFDRALDDAARIQELAHEGVVREDFTVSVNATARMLQDADDVDFVIAAVRARGLDAGRVVVDISGEEKKKLTVPDLLALFSSASGSTEANDKLLLS